MKINNFRGGLSEFSAYVVMASLLLQPLLRSLWRNEGVHGQQQQRAADVVVAKARGINCFDVPYYLSMNPNVFEPMVNASEVFRHFLAKGMMDYREHKWTCGFNASEIIPTWP